jgi:hypothetical protein
MADVFADAADDLVERVKAAAYNRGDQDYLNELGRAERHAAEGEQPPNIDAALDDFEQDRRQARVEAASGVRYSDTAAPDYVDPDPDPPTRAHAEEPDEAAIAWHDPRIHDLAAEHLPAPDDEPLTDEVRLELLTELGDFLSDEERTELAAPLVAAHAVANGHATEQQELLWLSDEDNAAEFLNDLQARGFDLAQLERLATAHGGDYDAALRALYSVGPVAPGLSGALDSTVSEMRHVRGASRG